MWPNCTEWLKRPLKHEYFLHLVEDNNDYQQRFAPSIRFQRPPDMTPSKILLAALLIALPFAAHAEETTQKSDNDTTKPSDEVWAHDTLTGDWGGYRTKLENKGVELGATAILDAQGNPTGGVNR